MTDDCPICCFPLHIEPMGACVPCGHVVHVNCFEAWAQHKKSLQSHINCPICNGPSLQFVKLFLDLSAAAAQNEAEDETLESPREEKMQRFLELQNEISELNKHIDDHAFSLKAIEFNLQTKDRELESLRLQYQVCLMEKEQQTMARLKSEERLRTLQVSLDHQMKDLFAEYRETCTTCSKGFELTSQYAQDNEQQLLQEKPQQQQDQQPTNNKRPTFVVNSDLTNSFKKPRTGERNTPSPVQNADRSHAIRSGTPLAPIASRAYYAPPQCHTEEEASCSTTANTTTAAVDGTNPAGGNPREARDRNDSEFQRIRHKQKRLLLLHHSVECNLEKAKCCLTRGCAKMKALRRHMERCKDNYCSVSHCRSTRAMLSHYKTCEDAACIGCAPMKEAVRTSRSSSAWADLQHLLL